MKNVKVYFFMAAAFALSCLSGCGKDPAKIVPQRALERWNLLINHEPVKAYEYLSPGYRATHTLDQYVAFIGTARLKWNSVAISSQQCEAEMCTLTLTVKSTIPAQMVAGSHDIEHEAPVTEHWVLSEGQWYLIPDVTPIPKNAAAESATAPAPPPAAGAATPDQAVDKDGK